MSKKIKYWVMLLFLSIGGVWLLADEAQADAVVTVRLPAGAPEQYRIGDTIELEIWFNEQVLVPPGGFIRAGVTGNGVPVVFTVEGTSIGQYKQMYNARMTVTPYHASGKLELGNLEAVAVRSDGMIYYDSKLHSVQFDDAVRNITLDTIELEWNAQVRIGNEPVDSENRIARGGQYIIIQLFSMNIGAAGADYFGQQSLMLNGSGQWATFYQAVPLHESRNGINLNRYAYEFIYFVPNNVRLDPLRVEEMIFNIPMLHNGRGFSPVLPESVKETIESLDILADSQNYRISVSPASDSIPLNRTDRKLFVIVTDPAGIDPLDHQLYYKWAKVGSSDDIPYNVTQTNGIAAGQPVPITESDIPEDGAYHLYIRAVDDAGNESPTASRFGPYVFDVTKPEITMLGYPNGSRFGPSDDPQFIVSMAGEETVTSVTYGWREIGSETFDAMPNGDGTWSVGGLPAGGNVYQLQLSSEDGAGNTSEATYYYVRDLSAPTVAGDVYGLDPGKPYQTVSIPLIVEPAPGDVTASGDTYTLYQIWSESAVQPDAVDPAWVELANAEARSPEGANGVLYLHVKAVDQVGNAAVYSFGDGFLLDNTAPQLQLGGGGRVACSVPYYIGIGEHCPEASVDPAPRQSLQLQLIVDGKSGDDLAGYTIEYNPAYSSDGTPPRIGYTNVYPVSRWQHAEGGLVEITGRTGYYYIVLKITDEAGNAQMFLTDGFTLDSRAPTGSAGFVQDYTNTTDVELYISAHDDAVRMSYSFDSEEYTDFVEFTNHATAIVSLPREENGAVREGEYTIYVRFEDAIGNQSGDIATDTIIYDATPPVVERVEYSPAEWTTDSVTVTVHYSDSYAPKEAALQRTFGDNGSMDVLLVDEAGNSMIYTIEVDHIDRLAPEVRFSEWGRLLPQRAASTVVSVADEQSGVNESTLSAVWMRESRLPNVGEPAWQSIHSAQEMTISGESGTWYLYVRTEDNAGNETTVRSDAFVLDNHPPELYVEYSPSLDDGQQQIGDRKVPGPITATLRANNDQIFYDGGMLDYTFGHAFTVTRIVEVLPGGGEAELYGGEECPELGAGAGCPKQVTFEENTDRIFRFYAIDGAGNIAYVDTAPITVIDPSVPSADVTVSTEGWTQGPVEATIKVDTAVAGRYRLRDFWSFPGELIRVVTQEPGGELHVWEGDALPDGADWHSYDVVEVAYRFHDNGYIEYVVERCVADDCAAQPYRQEIGNIDNDPPGYALIYSLPELSPSEIVKYPDLYTNRDVSVMILPVESQSAGVTITSEGGAIHTFTTNGSHTFIIEDEAGNVTEVPVVIDRIIKDAASEPIVTYSTTTWTNQPVTATIDFDYDNTGRRVRLEGSDEYVSTAQFQFEDNGTRVIAYTDQADNRGQVTLQVDWIDTVAPTGTVTYLLNDAAWGGQWTNRDITAVLTAVDDSGLDPVVIDAAGNVLPDGATHIFAANGRHTFTFRDRAGNIGSITAEVNRIDKSAPNLSVEYSNEKWVEDTDGSLILAQVPTNGAIRATVRSDEPMFVTNNDGSIHYDFHDNGEFTFTVTDRAGNISEITAKVDSIDREPPTLSITYSPAGPGKTKQDVVAELTADEPIRVLNHAGRKQYVFRENGEFTFLAEDEAGNIAEAKAVVDWIDKSKVEYEVVYSETNPTTEAVTAEIVTRPEGALTQLDGSPLQPVIFSSNGLRWVAAKDALGNEYLIEMRVMNIDRLAPSITFAGPLLASQHGEVDPLQGVTAEDNWDGDVTDSIEIIFDTTDPAVPGEYEIVYRVADQAGNTAEIKRQVLIVSGDKLQVYINGTPAQHLDVVNGDTLHAIK